VLKKAFWKNLMSEQKSVVVGLSGGVDSAVSALLLKQQGYKVIGVFMHNWDDGQSEFSECQAQYDWNDVANICSNLDIPYYMFDFRKDYMEKVFQPFLSHFKQGLTPNPDILCNREIKFKVFFEKALSLGADYIATGHYCQTDGKVLLKGHDSNKDQSYFLSAIKGEVLDKVLFPIGHLEKSQVRDIAKENNLSVCDKKDSTGICFVGEKNFRLFLQQYIPKAPGDFCLLDGSVVGTHEGVYFYTIGQRRYLGLGGEGGRWFVVKKDVEKNIVYVSREESHPQLYSKKIRLKNISWITNRPSSSYSCLAKIRYRQPDQKCVIKTIDKDHLEVAFIEPQRAVALQQTVVFYDGKECLGGGVVESII
jgi:tRNA-uridine 2-sulfurtransferase